MILMLRMFFVANFFILNSYKSIWLDLNKVNYFPSVTFLTKIRKNQGNIFSNFSCMFLNPYDFFQFEFKLFCLIRSEKSPGTS